MARTDEAAKPDHENDVLRSHWVKPSGPAGYYWFLTFEHSVPLHSLVAESQRSIELPYYDLVPLQALHLTLERIAGPGEISTEDLRETEALAQENLRAIPPFDLHVGALRRVPSAIVFDIAPIARVNELRSGLRAATVQASGPPVRTSNIEPHITLAYCNYDGPVPPKVVTAVAGLDRSKRTVSTRVVDAVMVLLQRGRTSYSWEPIARIPLAGDV
ncbi:2'-5' RNA ligase family protein [Nocardia sp. NBC_01329]|uniref:2'-5' RNA ligase family protein n=1 Tax=Nocardia sp. NBC_01329 TaxID=2903594 RepID=UPI002E14EBA2|nr:2'-5' RNA ligase family protein [Nocardia sp. NBC_01329]